jgi:hypothetical protein
MTTDKATCLTDDCDKPSVKLGLCGKHYQRQRYQQRGPCLRDGCPGLAQARGLCPSHYREDRAAGRACRVEGCAKTPAALGLCPMHYLRQHETGDPGEAQSRRQAPRACRVDGCGMISKAKGLCPKHYSRVRLYETVDGLFVTHKKCSICGQSAMHGPRSSDRCEPHYWDLVLDLHLRGEEAGTTDPQGYVYLSVRKRRRGVHRMVMERMLGRRLLSFETPHHKNGRRSDNAPSNLELWTKPQPAGQRPEDLAAWVVEFYPDLVAAALARAESGRGYP